jgi:hypothetical protein
MDTELPLANEFAAVFARMSGLMLSTETVATALELITALAEEVVPDTDGAGVTLMDSQGTCHGRGDRPARLTRRQPARSRRV